jgi:hypothetical protein
MCGGSSVSKTDVSKPPYEKTPAPYGASGTATPTSAVPVVASAYPSYGNRYKPAQGITPENLAQLQAMRDRVIGRASGVPYASSPQQFPQSAASSPSQPAPAEPVMTPATTPAATGQQPDWAAISKMPFFSGLLEALMRRQAGVNSAV